MINTINLAYYSHSVKTYNSDKENKEHDFLKTIIKGHVICPNKMWFYFNHIELGIIKYISITVMPPSPHTNTSGTR